MLRTVEIVLGSNTLKFINSLCQHLDDQPLGRVYAEYMTLLAKNRETPESPGGGFNPREMYHITNSPCFKDFVVDENEELTSENFAKLCPVVHGILQKVGLLLRMGLE